MNFKTLAISTLALVSLQSQAALIIPIYKYILTDGKVVELMGENQSKGTAYYYDYALSKRVEVNLADASKETKQRMNGVKAGEFVAATTVKGETICTTYNVFENGMAYLGCRTGKKVSHNGPTRHQVGGYTAKTENLFAESKEVDGFKKGETVELLKQVDNMKVGKKVKITAIFNNGLVLVESANPFAKLDTSSTLLKTNVVVVSTRDLAKL